MKRVFIVSKHEMFGKGIAKPGLKDKGADTFVILRACAAPWRIHQVVQLSLPDEMHGRRFNVGNHFSTGREL